MISHVKHNIKIAASMYEVDVGVTSSLLTLLPLRTPGRPSCPLKGCP